MKQDNEVGIVGEDGLAATGLSYGSEPNTLGAHLGVSPELTLRDLHDQAGPGKILIAPKETPAAHNQPVGAVHENETAVKFAADDIKVAPHHSTLRRAERRRARKLPFAAGAIAMLALGWVAGANTQSLAIGET